MRMEFHDGLGPDEYKFDPSYQNQDGVQLNTDIRQIIGERKTFI